MRKINSFILLLFSTIVFAQNTKIDSLTLELKNTKDKYEIANINLQLAKQYERIDIKKSKDFTHSSLKYKDNDSLLAEIYNQLGRTSFFEAQLDSATFYFEKTKNFFKKSNNQKRIAEINISLGAVQLKQANYYKTIETLTNSAVFFEKNNDHFNAAKCYNNISSAFAELNNYPKAIEYSKKALLVFEDQNLTHYQLITLPNLAMQFFKNGDTLTAISYNLKAEKLGLQNNNKYCLATIYNNLGSIYLDKNPQRAKEYLLKTLKLKNEMNLITGIEITQGNLGYLHFKNKEFKKAIQYYDLVVQKVNGKQLIFAYDMLKDCYKGLNSFDTALEYSEKSKILTDSILNSESQKQILEIQTKYETAKKEREIEALKAKNIEIDFIRKINRNLLFAAIIILISLFLLVITNLRNYKRKKLLAKQKHTIQTQNLEKRLKDQELNGIDAIIDAQEKERIRIANDLHDNLGSKMATLKLYIEEISNIKNHKEKEVLLSKLKKLADNTYKEIRTIAHKKNFGTFINKGLIPSIQAIANQISNSHKLSVKVINVNVDKHISNTIEIQIFRIVQELLTNCIKHADANEVIIQFSEYEKILNIVVEDNGKGFDKNKTTFGIGLKNINDRIKKIGGTMNIDSELNIGSSIILDVPL
ncbi:MAG: sensor histidine kinase [Flavobacteriaceae bacterium]|nr:sensor histidine kinase [Flavobacteriaceae bacterium]